MIKQFIKNLQTINWHYDSIHRNIPVDPGYEQDRAKKVMELINDSLNTIDYLLVNMDYTTRYLNKLIPTLALSIRTMNIVDTQCNMTTETIAQSLIVYHTSLLIQKKTDLINRYNL